MSEHQSPLTSAGVETLAHPSPGAHTVQLPGFTRSNSRAEAETLLTPGPGAWGGLSSQTTGEKTNTSER